MHGPHSSGYLLTSLKLATFISARKNRSVNVCTRRNECTRRNVYACCLECNKIIHVPCKTNNEADATINPAGKWRSGFYIMPTLNWSTEQCMTCLAMCVLYNKLTSAVAFLFYRVIELEGQVLNLQAKQEHIIAYLADREIEDIFKRLWDGPTSPPPPKKKLRCH